MKSCNVCRSEGAYEEPLRTRFDRGEGLEYGDPWKGGMRDGSPSLKGGVRGRSGLVDQTVVRVKPRHEGFLRLCLEKRTPIHHSAFERWRHKDLTLAGCTVRDPHSFSFGVLRDLQGKGGMRDGSPSLKGGVRGRSGLVDQTVVRVKPRHEGFLRLCTEKRTPIHHSAFEMTQESSWEQAL
jgi:hypothetical protein